MPGLDEMLTSYGCVQLRLGEESRREGRSGGQTRREAGCFLLWYSSSAARSIPTFAIRYSLCCSAQNPD
jgi:hypothetical protein